MKMTFVRLDIEQIAAFSALESAQRRGLRMQARVSLKIRNEKG